MLCFRSTVAIVNVVRAVVARTYIRPRVLAELRWEARMLAVRWKYRLNPRALAARRTLAAADDVRLHFGCGDRIFAGWVNIDATPRRGMDLQMDLRMPLPLRDGSTRFIFAEHVLEHMDRSREVPRILAEFHRILKPGGAVRIIVPDLSRYCDAFLRRDMEWLRAARPDCATHVDALNTVFYDHFHRFNYDADALIRHLQAAGFAHAAQTPYGGSAFPELRLDLQEVPRSHESLCVEAVKAPTSTAAPGAA